MTEYCAVIGTHSTVWGDKLLYGQIPDPLPWCGIGSGHARISRSVLIPPFLARLVGQTQPPHEQGRLVSVLVELAVVPQESLSLAAIP